MTTINCSANCVYQKDGNCSFEEISHKIVTPDSTCAYFLDPIQESNFPKKKREKNFS